MKECQEENDGKMDQNDIDLEQCKRFRDGCIRCYNILRQSPHKRLYSLPQIKAIEFSVPAEPKGFCERFFWEVPSISEQSKQAIETPSIPIVSPSWFSQHGYHLQMRLFLNGHGRCFGSHVSVFLSVLRGAYDKFLKWPALGNISFFMLDPQNNLNLWARTRCLDRDAFPQPTQTISEVNAGPL